MFWSSSNDYTHAVGLVYLREHGDCNYTEHDAEGVYNTIRSIELFRRREEDHVLVWTSPTSLF